MALALRVLRPAAGLAPTDLLALDFAGVARHEARIPQRLAQALVELDERAGEAVPNRAGLARRAAAIDLDGDVEPAHELHRLEGLSHDHAAGLPAEELIERAIVHRDATGPGLQVHACGCGLATSGAVVILLGRCHARSYRISSGFCWWALCGCSEPGNTCRL